MQGDKSVSLFFYEKIALEENRLKIIFRPLVYDRLIRRDDFLNFGGNRFKVSSALVGRISGFTEEAAFDGGFKPNDEFTSQAKLIKWARNTYGLQSSDYIIAYVLLRLNREDNEEYNSA